MPSHPVWTQLPTNTPREQGYIRLVCGKGPMSIERDLCLSKETYTYVERDPTHIHTSRAGRGALQHTATHWYLTREGSGSLPHTTTHWNAKQHNTMHRHLSRKGRSALHHTAAHHNARDYTAAHTHICRTHTYFAHTHISHTEIYRAEGAAHCNATQRNTIQRTATNCNTHISTHCANTQISADLCIAVHKSQQMQYTNLNTQCNTSTHSAIHKSQHTLQHTATHCNTLQTTHTCRANAAAHFNKTQHTATHCNTHTPAERREQHQEPTNHQSLTACPALRETIVYLPVHIKNPKCVYHKGPFVTMSSCFKPAREFKNGFRLHGKTHETLLRGELIFFCIIYRHSTYIFEYTHLHIVYTYTYIYIHIWTSTAATYIVCICIFVWIFRYVFTHDH